MIYNFLKRWIKQLFCNHKYKVRATGKYKNTAIGSIDVYHLQCYICNKRKDVITYPNKSK